MSNNLQDQFIAAFNEKYRPKFNEKIFHRSHYDTIEELKKIILSNERDDFYTIKVTNFTVVEDYAEIMRIMYEYERKLYEGKKRKRDNVYEYVNLKDSDIILLIVDYFISIGGKGKNISVYICVPRIVNKYYLRINGNYYCSSYQIVDGSTYNNATSSAIKKNGIVLRNNIRPIKIYRNYTDLDLITGEKLTTINYTIIAFSKAITGFKYILARFGYLGSMEFLGFPGIITLATELNDFNTKDDVYTFVRNHIYITVPKFLFDNEPMIQSMIYTIYVCINRNTVFEELFTQEYWLKSLGLEFNYATLEKGMDLLYSLETSCDIKAIEEIRIPQEDKQSIYHIIRWMMREFTALNVKDNLDIFTKRIRMAEMQATMYGMKLTKGIIRIAKMGPGKAKMDTIEKAICISPTYLLTEISRNSLVSYRDLVNDLDSITALKFSFKGIGGIGENSSKSIPLCFRQTNPSYLGVLDMDSSSKSDPGMGGILCPMTEIYDGGYFNDAQEPNTWKEKFIELMDEYKSLSGLKEIFTMKENLLGTHAYTNDKICIDVETHSIKRLIEPFRVVEEDAVEEFPLEASGTIVYG